jgi:hypothetical protein
LAGITTSKCPNCHCLATAGGYGNGDVRRTCSKSAKSKGKEFDVSERMATRVTMRSVALLFATQIAKRNESTPSLRAREKRLSL